MFGSGIALLPRADIMVNILGVRVHWLSPFLDGLRVLFICGCVLMSIAAVVFGVLAERDIASSGGTLRGEDRTNIAIRFGTTLLIIVALWTLLVLLAPDH